MSRQDIKDVWDNIKGKVDVKFRDVQRKDSRRWVKQLVDAKLNEMKKLEIKSIMKNRKEAKAGRRERGEARCQGQGRGGED